MSVKGLPAIDPAERRLIAFVFTEDMQPSDQITDASLDIVSTRDASATDRLDGMHLVDGPRVLQWFKGSVPAIYLIKCTVTLNSGEVLAVTAQLPVTEGA